MRRRSTRGLGPRRKSKDLLKIPSDARGHRKPKGFVPVAPVQNFSDATATAVDWRLTEAVTPIKNQGGRYSCMGSDRVCQVTVDELRTLFCCGVLPADQSICPAQGRGYQRLGWIA